MKVLLIEDSKTLQHLIGGYVEKAGHDLTIVSTGELALQMLEEEPFDLVLSDVDMPGLNGFDTVKLIREMLGEHWVPIIFLTSRETDEDYLNGFNAGGDDYLIKPVREVVLLAKIRVMERFINMQNKLIEVLNAPQAPTQFDPLTHTYTNHAFLDMATLQWSVLARREEPVSLVAVDIDYFIEYREHYGKELADKCLVAVAKAIKSALKRPNDFIGRFSKGGYLLMLPSTNLVGTELVVGQIEQAVELLSIEHKKSPKSGEVSVSIAGMCSTSPAEHGLEDNIEALVKLLYEIKQGRFDETQIRQFY